MEEKEEGAGRILSRGEGEAGRRTSGRGEKWG